MPSELELDPVDFHTAGVGDLLDSARQAKGELVTGLEARLIYRVGCRAGRRSRRTILGGAMTEFEYDADKFRELVLYIADRCSEDPGFGDTRLNKVLFFSDAFALQYLGAPITNSRYQKLERGPASRALLRRLTPHRRLPSFFLPPESRALRGSPSSGHEAPPD